MNWQSATKEDREKVKAYMLKCYPQDWRNLESFKPMGARLETIKRNDRKGRK